ncbi:branched-chain amino acid ABC transporter permease [Neoaquamicrobium sediminum]|uniref:branched-chain amino acid ABC transporter permease n=1 Tax=Neoaquamicrobium sediminum TaxID=1849104 RepID=UPI0015652DED|nr:branched-chain amino acid ABC transporter permease [Mesorhizobium sediminum]NRC57241.1 branched-chain amino acid ABC transporter permease [Mesorhizobium sediminum]
MLSVLLASGVANGLLYGLIALGVVVLSKAANAINFSQGDVMALGCFVSYSVIVVIGDGPVAAVLFVVIAALFVGLLSYLLLRPLLKTEHAVAVLIATIGLSFLIKGLIRLTWGGRGDYLAVPPLITGPPLILFDGAIIVPLQYLVMMAGAVFIILLFALFFRFTRLGLFMRSVADNPRAAQIVGIPTQLVLCSAMVLSLTVSAIAGFLLAPATIIFPDMGFALFLKGFAAAIIGGMTSLPGAVVGGILLGVTEVLVSGYVASQAQELSAFILIFIALIFFPRGLFGGRKSRSV